MDNSLTKQELIAIVAEKSAISKKQAGEIIDTVFETISTGLLRGRKFTAKGFGTFNVQSRQPRAGVNPQTGEAMVIPGKLVAKFKAGKQLSETLNSAEGISNWVNR